MIGSFHGPGGRHGFEHFLLDSLLNNMNIKMKKEKIIIWDEKNTGSMRQVRLVFKVILYFTSQILRNIYRNTVVNQLCLH